MRHLVENIFEVAVAFTLGGVPLSAITDTFCGCLKSV